MQQIEQRLRLAKVGRVEAIGEPAVHRREKIAGFAALAAVAPKPGEAYGASKFE
jgi:hypothetical protein